MSPVPNRVVWGGHHMVGGLYKWVAASMRLNMADLGVADQRLTWWSKLKWCIYQTSIGHLINSKPTMTGVLMVCSNDHKVLLMFVVAMLAIVAQLTGNDMFLSKCTNVNTKVCMWLLTKSDICISSCSQGSIDK